MDQTSTRSTLSSAYGPPLRSAQHTTSRRQQETDNDSLSWRQKWNNPPSSMVEYYYRYIAPNEGRKQSAKQERNHTFIRRPGLSYVNDEQQKWDDTYYREHRRKVAEAKPMVNTMPPQTYMHLHLKLKKLQLEEERVATVERDNRILLEKMSQVMKTRGRVDNRNKSDYKSLNREKRMRELLRVSQENQEILRRITQRKPEYNSAVWRRDWQRNKTYMDQISAYPRDWWKQPPPKSGRMSRQPTSTSMNNYNKHEKRKQEHKKEDKSAKPKQETKDTKEQDREGSERDDKEVESN